MLAGANVEAAAAKGHWQDAAITVTLSLFAVADEIME
jgi:hypothetical protein